MDNSTAPRSKSSYPTRPSERARALHHHHHLTPTAPETGVTATATDRALSPPRVRVRTRARRGTSVGIGNSPPVDSTTRTAAPRLRVGPHHGTYTVRARAPVRVLGPRFVVGVYWAPGGGLPATSVVDTVVGAVQNRTALLCVQAALGPRRPLGRGRGPGVGLVLGLSLALALVLVHGPARGRAPHLILRIPGGALGPDPTVGAVEAIVGMTSGTADLARPFPKNHDSRRNSSRLCISLRVENVSQI